MPAPGRAWLEWVECPGAAAFGFQPESEALRLPMPFPHVPGEGWHRTCFCPGYRPMATRRDPDARKDRTEDAGAWRGGAR